MQQHACDVVIVDWDDLEYMGSSSVCVWCVVYRSMLDPSTGACSIPRRQTRGNLLLTNTWHLHTRRGVVLDSYLAPSHQRQVAELLQPLMSFMSCRP